MATCKRCGVDLLLSGDLWPDCYHDGADRYDALQDKNIALKARVAALEAEVARLSQPVDWQERLEADEIARWEREDRAQREHKEDSEATQP